jgi:hypothetical protein
VAGCRSVLPEGGCHLRFIVALDNYGFAFLVNELRKTKPRQLAITTSL